MSHKNGKITKVINDTKYDIYVKTSADQVVYDDTTSVKQKMLEIINALNNGSGIGGGDSVSVISLLLKLMLRSKPLAMMYLIK